ncbi:MAG: bifunctional (p)ppGpp synthetase/guanosine-3',5'-bis(diphosphate) 3'-pyrophosphohydrolase [Spirochaetales bacterium]|nr:bifunctional (p)ppGpp synthetase/guanosine-3',5'-bis(diphosphate) 3'-pyrophosphohydrolase [Spirochaetales bacterium]
MTGLLIRESDLDSLKKVFRNRLERFSPEEISKILRAEEWAELLHKEQKRASGEPYIIHPLQVAAILVELKMDASTVIAGLLHDILEDTATPPSEIERLFGSEVVSLVDGVTKIHILHAKTKSVQEAETIRKMFFAMIKDLRVIMIKLADKVHNMTTLQHLSDEKARRIATECLDIYAPLAGRLGISNLKNQLEDLALKSLDRSAYYQIKEWVDSKRDEREAYLRQVEKVVHGAALQEGVEVTVDARAKHFYSIYTKWKKGRDLGEVFDMLGVRIFCQTTTECYTLLGVVHRLWKPIDGRFKDYIAMPKDNGYQSLHTTVMGDQGRLIEIQIRTYDMHRTAEYGIAAHWIYKTSGKIDSVELSIVNKLRSWQSENATSENFLEEIKGELLKDAIYVFTPKGRVVELPLGATALDFAYSIHTEVGNHTMAAKANGAIIPLNQELKNTQVIEIVTSPQSRPHVNWLRNVKTSRARSKIRSWLAHNDDGLVIEKNIVAKTSRKDLQPETKPLPAPPLSAEILPTQRVADLSKVSVRIEDQHNVLIRFAQCCTPAAGDPIIGFVSRGRGIIIHREDCPNVSHIPGIDHRRIEVEWETVSPFLTRRFRVVAKRSGDLFSEIEGAIRKHGGHLIEGRLEDDHQGHLIGSFTMELEARNDSGKILKALRAIPSIHTIQRL